MSLVVTKYPQVDVNGHTSKWQSVHHPITFELQRQDQQVQMKFHPTGIGVIVKVAGAIPSTIQVGQNIQYFATNGDIYTWIITDIQGENIFTDGTIPGTQYGGFVNYLDAYSKYFVSTEVYGVDTSNTYFLIGTLRHKPSTNGKLNITINEWLTSLIDLKNNFAYNQINKAMREEGGKYQVRFREQYNGTEQVQFAGANYYWSNSAKQIGEVYGSNMGDFVPTPDNTRVNRAKFLSVFPKPTYFAGFPFSLNFIYSDNMTSRQLTREEETFDINGTSIATSSTNILMSERFFNNRLLINHPYDPDVKEVDVWIEAGAETTDGDYYQEDFVDPSYGEPIIPGGAPVKPVKLTK